MLWGVPAALLLVAGAVPLILFLHSRKPKGLKVNTTTLFLWERVLRERPLRTRLGWLVRKNLLLILQIVAAGMLILALADPSLLHFAAPPGDTVVVLDLSASMKARGAAGTRFDSARKELVRLIDGLSAGHRMMLIGAGVEPRLMLPFTADKKRLKEATQNVLPTDAPGRIKEAILFAHAFVKRGTSDRIVTITDGAFTGVEDFRPAAHLRFIKIEGGKDNVGIVGFEMRRYPDNSSRVEVMVRMKNFTANRSRVPLTLSFGQEILARQTIDLPAGGEQVVVFPFGASSPGTLVARLDIEDDFVTDNQAYLAVPDAPPMRLLYVGPGNPFLSNLLRLFPNIEVTAVRRWDEAGASPANAYDVFVFDRVAVPALTEGNVILIDTLSDNLPLRLTGKTRAPRILAPLGKHPLTEGVNLSGVRIREALRLLPTGKGEVLARSAETPLIFASASEKLRLLLLGFDLTASDLPLRVAFPVLFHNAMEWFQPRRTEFPAENAPAGAPFMIRLPPAASDVEVIAPSGKKEIYQGVGSRLLYTDTFEVGFYQYRSAGRAGRFAVNLVDDAESQIVPRWSFAASAAADKDSPQAHGSERGFPLWPMLLSAALLLLGFELWLTFRAGISMVPALARTVAMAAVVLALLDLEIFQPTNALDVVLGVDLSRSVGQEAREKAGEVLEAARGAMGPETRTGLLFFGRAPEWEFLPRREFSAVEFTGRMDREETDIQAALQAAVAQMDEQRQKRILLISDGNENRGEISRVIPLLRAQGTQVWTLPATIARGRNEIYVSDFTLPQRVDDSETFEIVAAVESLRQAGARLKLLRDGVLHREQDIKLQPGTNTVSFRDHISQRGSHTYEVALESEDDTLAENNLLQGVVEVRGPPKVLVVSTQRDSQRFISRVLELQGYSVFAVAPEDHPLPLSELASYDLVVLDNVPAFQLAHAKMDSIEKYVRDLGGGLLVIGGSQSYGAGGYYRTPLERILPVDMRPPARLDFPHVALLFVLDKSGSMGAGPDGSTKLDLAKAAAIAAADVMNPSDQVGILAFDAAWDWALPFRPVGKGEWISDRLADLQSDGGTDLYKALVEAHRAIAGKQAAIKHVIVLSDGLTDKADFNGLIQKMTRDNITVSTVSIGSDADVQLMADLAKSGKGRGYVALDPHTVPQIFTTETLLISRDLLIEKTVTPTIDTAAAPLKGIAEIGLPSLGGYVLTYPKARAEMLMKVDNDPLLVSWRYGLGRVSAFTSDLSGRWGREWVAWKGFPLWASQLARHTMRQLLDSAARAEFKVDKEYVTVIADLRSKQGDFINQLHLKGNVAAPNQIPHEQSFQQTAPGRYQGKFIPARHGIHFLTLYAQRDEGESPVAVGTFPYIAPYPKEYRQLRPNLSALSRLAEATGGEMLDPGDLKEGVKRLYAPALGKSGRAQQIWWPLSAGALLFFLTDLVLRVWPVRPVLRWSGA
jgi:Mg-chelatase subunit ChlD